MNLYRLHIESKDKCYTIFRLTREQALAYVNSKIDEPYIEITLTGENHES